MLRRLLKQPSTKVTTKAKLLTSAISLPCSFSSEASLMMMVGPAATLSSFSQSQEFHSTGELFLAKQKKGKKGSGKGKGSKTSSPKREADGGAKILPINGGDEKNAEERKYIAEYWAKADLPSVEAVDAQQVANITLASVADPANPNLGVTLPYAWFRDHDQLNFTKFTDQRIAMFDPNECCGIQSLEWCRGSAESQGVDGVQVAATAPTSGIQLRVTWSKKNNAAPPPQENSTTIDIKKSNFSLPSNTNSSSGGCVVSQVIDGRKFSATSEKVSVIALERILHALSLTSASVLGATGAAKIPGLFVDSVTPAAAEFYGPRTPAKFIWDTQSILAEPPTASHEIPGKNPPPCSHVQNFLGNPSSKAKEAIRNLEKYGFCIVSDPSLAVNVGKTLKDGPGAGFKPTVQARSKNAEKLITSIFPVLRNSHYGAFGTWSANVENTAKKVSQGNKTEKSQGGESGEYLDGAYDNCYLDLHTDTTYFRESAKVQCFGCIYNSAKETKGGESTLCDGFQIARLMKERYPEQFDLLTKVPVGASWCKQGQRLLAYQPVFQLSNDAATAAYDLQRQYDSNSIPQQFNTNPISPIFGMAARGTVEVPAYALAVASCSPAFPHEVPSPLISRFSFNSNDRLPMKLCKELPTASALHKFYEAYYQAHLLIHDPANYIKFTLEPGDMLFFDNWRVMHGRWAFTGPRVMCGSYIGVDEFFSKLRMACLPE